MKIITKAFSIMALSALIFSGCNNQSGTSETEVPHHEESESMVELTPAQYKVAGIELGRIEQKNLSNVIKVNGILQTPPQSLASINAVIGGFVKETSLLPGNRIEKGEVVVVLEHPDYIQLQLDYLESDSKLTYLEQEFARQKGLQEKNVNSAKTFQRTTADYKSIKARVSALEQKLALIGISAKELRESEKISRTIKVYSPISGYVSRVNVNIGKYMNPADVMFEIVNTEHLHAELTVFEKDIGKIKEGQRIRFTLPNEDNRERLATVHLIGRLINEHRVVKVHGHLDKEDEQYFPGMFIKAFIEINNNTVNALPEDAIVQSGGKHYIYIFKGNRIEDNQEMSDFEMIEIQKGVTEGIYTEVILPDTFDINSDKIVLKGAYSLLSKMKVSGEEDGHGH
ncbi:MAG: efflux RND transporter periplasmic adaptor subunit [Candidatus Scalindua sp.]|nr:efflux RND transporter periplasmic adaptor subunit [Candidatus Scalindua sp.]MCR4344703.1 efflux RND transporter periplasmic adaptor subunit [Candidatus Scalindua sp.]